MRLCESSILFKRSHWLKPQQNAGGNASFENGTVREMYGRREFGFLAANGRRR